MTLYWPLIAGTANVILTAEIFGIERTSLWNNLTVRATLFMTSRESADVTLSLEFRIDFSSVLRVKCNITDISLLFGKYTRTFVPRFPGIPEMLYFPPPSASGNITSRGFPGTSGQTFWYISLKAMKYLYNNICEIETNMFLSNNRLHAWSFCRLIDQFAFKSHSHTCM